MYIDPDTEQGEMADKCYVFKEEMGTLCCPKVFQVGEIVKVRMYTSKNRLLILSTNGGLHKVKRSSLNRTTEEIDISEFEKGKGNENI